MLSAWPSIRRGAEPQPLHGGGVVGHQVAGLRWHPARPGARRPRRNIWGVIGVPEARAVDGGPDPPGRIRHASWCRAPGRPGCHPPGRPPARRSAGPDRPGAGRAGRRRGPGPSRPDTPGATRASRAFRTEWQRSAPPSARRDLGMVRVAGRSPEARPRIQGDPDPGDARVVHEQIERVRSITGRPGQIQILLGDRRRRTGARRRRGHHRPQIGVTVHSAFASIGWLGRAALGTLDDLEEDLARLDHAQLAPRPLLQGLLAGRAGRPPRAWSSWLRARSRSSSASWAAISCLEAMHLRQAALAHPEAVLEPRRPGRTSRTIRRRMSGARAATGRPRHPQPHSQRKAPRPA